ncbi:uncharacterized protein LOC121876607 isoform X1 [Homarus americanus]|uniref:uncharacterized protein LOC121876607 isoform X1 n=1 Tax=Homarus americanus TaxID=6706 RepID=UPI001C4614E4|nr:uncharacterized protein LOC121876607 isoform X1 [Homarus americanus]
MEVWNKREISRPPDYSIKYTQEERRLDNFDVCAQSLLEGVLCGHAVLCDTEVSGCFQREAAILTATLFQNGRHRTEKFYRVLKRVEKCSERWKELNLRENLDNLRQMMPTIPPAQRPIRMPSKQMFEYLLIRVLGGFHLLLSLDGYCREASGYLMSKISSGHFFSTAMVFLANVARIRALALDLSGQLAKLYDDIFPWVQQLKGGSVPGVVTQGSLPQALTDDLHKYCSSLEVKSNSVIVKETGKYVQSSSLLSIFKEEEDKTITDSQLNEPAGHKRGLVDIEDEAVSCIQAKRPSCEKTELDVDYRPRALLMTPEEDIGVSVDSKKKLPRKSSSLINGVKKQKHLSGSLKTGIQIMNKSVGTAKNSSVSRGKKRKGDTDMLESNKKSKNGLDHYCPSLLKDESKVTQKFVKHYQRVNNNLKKICAVKDFNKFLKMEKMRRLEKDKKRISILLKKEEWKIFTKLIRKRVKKAEKLNSMKLSVSERVEVERLVAKTKIRIKFWLLYPDLKGKKPEDWKNILCEIKNNRTKPRRNR